MTRTQTTRVAVAGLTVGVSAVLAGLAWIDLRSAEAKRSEARRLEAEALAVRDARQALAKMPERETFGPAAVEQTQRELGEVARRTGVRVGQFRSLDGFAAAGNPGDWQTARVSATLVGPAPRISLALHELSGVQVPLKLTSIDVVRDGAPELRRVQANLEFEIRYRRPL